LFDFSLVEARNRPPKGLFSERITDTRIVSDDGCVNHAILSGECDVR